MDISGLVWYTISDEKTSEPCIFQFVYIIAKHNWITLVLLSISITATYMLQKKKAMYEYQMKRSLTTDERRINYYKSALLDKKLAKDIRYSGAFALIRQCFDRQSRDYSDKMFRKNGAANVGQDVDFRDA